MGADANRYPANPKKPEFERLRAIARTMRTNAHELLLNL